MNGLQFDTEQAMKKKVMSDRQGINDLPETKKPPGTPEGF